MPTNASNMTTLDCFVYKTVKETVKRYQARHPEVAEEMNARMTEEKGKDLREKLTRAVKRRFESLGVDLKPGYVCVVSPYICEQIIKHGSVSDTFGVETGRLSGRVLEIAYADEVSMPCRETIPRYAVQLSEGEVVGMLPGYAQKLGLLAFDFESSPPDSASEAENGWNGESEEDDRDRRTPKQVDGWANARIPKPSSPAFETLMANGKDWRKGGHWRTYFRASDFRRYLGFKKGAPPHPWLTGVPPVVIDEWLSKSYFDNLTKKFVFQASEQQHVGALRALVAKAEAWW